MSIRTKICIGVIALAAATLGMGAGASAADVGMRPGGPAPVVTPGPIFQQPSPVVPAEYTVTATRFYVADESGPDLFSSDTPYWVFSSVGNHADMTNETPIYADVDTGESRWFTDGVNCIYPKNCDQTGAPAPGGIGISINAWDSDTPFYDSFVASFYENYVHHYAQQRPDSFGWMASTIHFCNRLLNSGLEDNLLGTQTFTYSAKFLVHAVPYVGSTYSETRSFSGPASAGGARYSLTLQVTRTVRADCKDDAHGSAGEAR